MAYFLTWQPWRTFWYYNILSDVITYFVDLMNKQYSLREGIYYYFLTRPKFIYIHTDDGLARFGIIWILVICYIYYLLSYICTCMYCGVITPTYFIDVSQHIHNNLLCIYATNQNYSNSTMQLCVLTIMCLLEVNLSLYNCTYTNERIKCEIVAYTVIVRWMWSSCSNFDIILYRLWENTPNISRIYNLDLYNIENRN